MKNKIILVIFSAIAFVTLSGCIPEGPDTFTQDFPLVTAIGFSGTGPELSGSAVIDLNSSEFYRKNKDRMVKINLQKISFKTDSVFPGNMNGDLLFTLKRNDETIILSKNIPASWPSEYIVDPYEFVLTPAETNSLSEYLEDPDSESFIAAIDIVESGESAKTLTAKVFAVFTIEYEL